LCFFPSEKRARCDRQSKTKNLEQKKDEICKILWKREKWERKEKKRSKSEKVARGFFIPFIDEEGSY